MNRTAFLILAFALVCGESHAATMVFGDFVGSTVVFKDVTENTLDPTPLVYGSPLSINDSLLFMPNGFGASVGSGEGIEGIDSQLTTTIMSMEGHYIGEIRIAELGDYTLLGSDGMVTVAAPVRWHVLEIDGVPVIGPSGSDVVAFAPEGSVGNGVFELPADAGTGVLWDGELTIDVGQFLDDQGITGEATKVLLTFDNTLTATSSADDTFAFIKKKEVQIDVTTQIPEPAASLLASIGLVFIGTLRRRS